MTIDFTSSLTSAFNLPHSDSKLAELVRMAPKPAPEIHLLEPVHAARALATRLGEIFRASPTDLRIIRETLARSRAYIEQMYPSRDAFIAGAMGRMPEPPEPPFIMLTGHPGVGKSGLQLAIKRLIATGGVIQASEHLPPFPSHPIAHFQPRESIGKLQISEGLMKSVGVLKGYTGRRGEESENVRQKLYQRGCALIMLDEVQFTTFSSTANAKPAALLMQLWYVGVPVLYACNYSFGHRMQTRPPEEQTRLLGSPIVMLPELPDSEWFAGYLQDINVVLGGSLQVDVVADAREIHEMTFGLKRSVIKLIGAACLVAWQASTGNRRGPVPVTMEHLRSAYGQSRYGYETEKRMVKNCARALLDLAVEKDFVCPFELEASDVKRQRDMANEVRARALSAAQLLSAQPRSERTEVQAVARRTSTASSVSSPPKARSAPPRPKSAEAMQANLRRLGIPNK